MKYCKFANNRLIPVDEFEKIKDSVCSLFSPKEEGLVGVYRSSLNILYQKAHQPDFIINKHIYPIETSCLKEKQLLKDDNSLEYNVKVFVDYLIGFSGKDTLELLDNPVHIVEVPLIKIDTAYQNLA